MCKSWRCWWGQVWSLNPRYQKDSTPETRPGQRSKWSRGFRRVGLLVQANGAAWLASPAPTPVLHWPEVVEQFSEVDLAATQTSITRLSGHCFRPTTVLHRAKLERVHVFVTVDNSPCRYVSGRQVQTPICCYQPFCCSAVPSFKRQLLVVEPFRLSLPTSGMHCLAMSFQHHPFRHQLNEDWLSFCC